MAPGHADETRNDEEAAPCVSRDKRAAEKRAQGWSASDSSSDKGVCKASAQFRNVPYQRPGVAGIGGRFTDSQHQARGKQGREGVQGAGGRCGSGPNKKAKS